MEVKDNLTTILCDIYYHWKCDSCSKRCFFCEECCFAVSSISDYIIATVSRKTSFSHSKAILGLESNFSNKKIMDRVMNFLSQPSVAFDLNTILWLVPKPYSAIRFNTDLIDKLISAGASEFPGSESSFGCFMTEIRYYVGEEAYKKYLETGIKAIKISIL